MLLPVKLRAIEKSYGDKKVLCGLDLDLNYGGILGIVGKNGAGKTVLMRILSGLENPDRGSIFWGREGTVVPGKGDRGLMLQEPIILRRSAIKNVEFALQGISRKEKRAIAQEALAMVGLTPESYAYAPALSGGQKKRLCLAQIWAMRPQLMLLDEPSVHMDEEATEAFESLIRKLCREQHLQIVIATHDREQLKRLADKVAFLHGGKLQIFATVNAFLGRVQDHAL